MKPSILLLTLVLLSPSLHAKSMGVAGAIFPIGEIDMLLWIEQRLQRFEANGQMDIMKNDMKQAVKKQVERPTQVQGLGTTTEPATFYGKSNAAIRQRRHGRARPSFVRQRNGD